MLTHREDELKQQLLELTNVYLENLVSDDYFKQEVVRIAEAIKEEQERHSVKILVGPYYDPMYHDPDSVYFNDSYVGPSELELGGGCNRCGVPDDCYCNG